MMVALVENVDSIGNMVDWNYSTNQNEIAMVLMVIAMLFECYWIAVDSDNA